MSFRYNTIPSVIFLFYSLKSFNPIFSDSVYTNKVTGSCNTPRSTENSSSQHQSGCTRYSNTGRGTDSCFKTCYDSSSSCRYARSVQVRCAIQSNSVGSVISNSWSEGYSVYLTTAYNNRRRYGTNRGLTKQFGCNLRYVTSRIKVITYGCNVSVGTSTFGEICKGCQYQRNLERSSCYGCRLTGNCDVYNLVQFTHWFTSV
ncbi:hypothetical protein D3C86_1391390 [compost metagenome]